MSNCYHVINKWSTTDPTSPGYISGLRAGALLEQLKQFELFYQQGQITTDPLHDVLSLYGIPEEYFDLAIYTNYASTAFELSQTGKILGFTSAKLPDNSLCYSLLLYTDQADQNSLVTDNSTIIENFNTAKAAYMQLLNLECETRRGIKYIDTELLQRIFFHVPVSIQELENIFSTL